MASVVFGRTFGSDTHSFLLTRSSEMNSFAVCDIESKASSSKSKSALVMLANVSASLSPINGESPESLSKTKIKFTHFNWGKLVRRRLIKKKYYPNHKR